MLRCGAGRLRAAAAVGRALTGRLPHWCAAHKAHRLTCVTVTLHKGHTFEGSRSVCGSDHSTAAHLREGNEPQTQSWRGTERFGAAHRRLSERDLFSTQGGHLDVIRPWSLGWERRHGSSREPPCRAVFAGDCGVSSGRTMQSRASSTSAATKEVSAASTNSPKEQKLNEAPDPTPSPEKTPEEAEPEGGKPTKTQQLKKVFKEYGAVGVSFHIGISLMSLGMFYLLISSGIDMAAILCKLGFSESVVQSKMAAGTSTFVLAYAVHKLFAPVRISITLVSVPLIVRYFRKTGLFKPPTPSP